MCHQLKVDSGHHPPLARALRLFVMKYYKTTTHKTGLSTVALFSHCSKEMTEWRLVEHMVSR